MEKTDAADFPSGISKCSYDEWGKRMRRI